jgi:hypothetical protein
MADNVRNSNFVLLLKFSVVGSILLFIFSFCIDYGVKHSTDTQTGKVNKIINHSIDPATIIFGSSVSEVGFNTALLQQATGGAVYNCSVNGTPFSQYKVLIDEFASYSKNNKYVILSEAYFSFEKFNVITFPERYFAHISNDNFYATLSNIQPELLWKCRYIPFYKLVAINHNYYKNAMLGWKNIFKKSAPDSSNGFLPVDRNWELDADENIKNTKPFKVALDSSILKEYVQTITSLQAKGKRVIIVLTPMYEKVINTLTDIGPLRNKLIEVAETTGCKFLDFSQCSLCADKAFFYNSTHLNKNGADTFSKLLGDSLKLLVSNTGTASQ